MARILRLCAVLGMALAALSCGGNSTLNDTEAPVFFTVDIEQYGPDIPIPYPFDLTIDEMSIESHSKNPNATLTANQDARLTAWVVTPYRVDGGTVTSPQWRHDLSVYVPAGGSANLSNYRIYPAELLDEPPIVYLLPENGGFDPETGNSNIRQSFKVEVFGTTVSGKSVKAEFTVPFNFIGGTQ